MGKQYGFLDILNRIFDYANSRINVSVSGSKVGDSASASFTRPDNATAYDANDVICASASAGAAIEIANVGDAGQQIIIQELRLSIKKAATAMSKPTGMTAFKVHIYTENPTGINDGAAWTCGYADEGKYKDYIQTDEILDKGDFLKAIAPQCNKPITLVSTSLWYMIQTDGGFTPTALAVKTVEIEYLKA